MMSTAPGFSGVLKLTNLDDFITPSQECIKPVESVKIKKKGQIEIEEESSNSEATYEKAKITLSDCLACSGCITSAEVVLVNQQSYEQFLRLLDKNSNQEPDDKLIVVLSLSYQSVLSLAVKQNVDEQETFEKLIGYFRSIGVDYIFDTNFAQCFSILEAQKEFIKRYTEKDEKMPFPLLASACPGWVCYAEKTHGAFILPHISSTRSPQHVMGSLVKSYWATKMGLDPSRIYHVTVMPCFDKKLEASREEFSIPELDTREVDCVITTVEIDSNLESSEIDLKSMPRSLLDLDLSLSPKLSTFGGSGSGGYGHHIFTYAANHLFGVNQDELNWKTLRNNDMLEITLEHQDETVLKFAIANGFRNIQNVVQKIKRNKCPYHYVEIMACPSGCLNGGAQSRPNSGQSSKELVASLEKIFGSLPRLTVSDDSRIEKIYNEWLHDSSPVEIKKQLHTTYKEIEKNVNPLGIKW